MQRTSLRALALVAAVVAALTLANPAAANPILDPLNDNFGSQTHDITSFSGEIYTNPNFVRFTVDFAGPISSPAPFPLANSVFGFVDIDTDQNPLTGIPPLTTAFTNIPFNMGTDVFVDLLSEIFHPGFVDVFDALTSALLGTVPISYSGNSLTFDVPAALLGGNLTVNYALVIGDPTGPNDVAPNGPDPATTTPEPASLALFAVAGLAAFGYTWRRRRHQAVAA